MSRWELKVVLPVLSTLLLFACGGGQSTSTATLTSNATSPATPTVNATLPASLVSAIRSGTRDAPFDVYAPTALPATFRLGDPLGADSQSAFLTFETNVLETPDLASMTTVSFLEEYNPGAAAVSPGSLTCSSGSTFGDYECFVVDGTLYAAQVVRPVNGGLAYELTSLRGSATIHESVHWELPAGQAQEITDDLKQQAIAIAESLRPLSAQ
jgi:hypothetical protein